jgi:outer membrane protein OmpA-like peptidoglycan-associated protein
VEVTSTGIVIHQTIYFEFNRAVIRPVSFPILDTVAQVMRDFPDITIEIQGHTDSRGNDAYNMRLSGERAASVLQYLLQQGVAAQRMTSAGFGETRPIDSNRTPAGRARNRRVEFVRTDAAAQQSRQQEAVP